MCNKKIILNIGLGNPGKKYQFQRHNIGFLVLDEMIKNHNIIKSKTKFYSEHFETKFKNKKLIFLKPKTFMNNSGLAALSATKFFKVSLSSVYVWHDDIDLPCGKVKVKIGGGNGGHNGLKSIDESIGKDYVRIRIGVGRPKFMKGTSQWVLSMFSKDELNGWIKGLLPIISKEKSKLYNHEFSQFMNNVCQNFKISNTIVN